MSVSREQIERAIELAKKDNNQTAVTELTGMLDTSAGGEAQPALSVDAPALQQPRERELAQEQYDADQALLDSGTAAPTPEQINDFMGMRMGNTQWSDPSGRDLVVDQKTGKTRWTALSPDQLERVNTRKEEIAARGSTVKATAGALGYGGTRIGGALATGAEARIEARDNFQEFLLTGENSLPKPEQERIMNLAREKYGDDVDVKSIPAQQVKEWIEMNEANELAFRNIAGDEWWEERKETAARLGNRISSVVPRMPVNIFGADDPIGALTGPGSYKGIDYTGKRPPSYPGASAHLREWESSASRAEGLYEGLIMPLTQAKTGKSPGQHAVDYSQGFIDRNYSEEQLAERHMPLLSADIEINSLGDLWDAVTSDDPNTKIRNPESLWLMFAENAPELGISFAVTRGAGGASARGAAKDAYGQTVANMNKAREAAAARGGMLAGGATEGILVQQHLEQETRSVLGEIPIETWEKDENFQAMVEAGVTPEGAKQILTQEKASQAGTTAALVTMLTGAPMNRFMGKSAAGELVQKSPTARRTTGALGEPLTEGLQEVMEMMQTEAAVRPIDPDNPIFEDPNRYWEAGLSGAVIATPFGIAGGLQPGTPAGVEKGDVDAIRATTDYMNATNERFKYETMIASPEQIAKTSPNERIKQLDQLETLQLAESEAILKAEAPMREFLEKQGTQTAKTELKMLNRLVMRANAMKNDIAVAKSKRTTATQLQEAERQVMQDRAELQRKVNEQIIKLEDIQALTSAIESVQNLESISTEQEAELVREGYAKRSKDGQLVVLPKGRRATKELNRQARALKGKLDKGYTGKERRQGENLVKRELVESAGPVEKEQMLYQDPLTGAQNRRAFNERQENIDVRARYGKPPWTEDEDGRGPPPPPTSKAVEKQPPPQTAAPAVAVVDVDSLAWVNDNMSHSAGDRVLVAVSDALSKQAGVEVFRLGGDEFAVTGASQEALETAMQAAATELSETEIIAGEDVVTPQITWGKGENYEQADAESLTMKDDRMARSVIAKRKKKAATYQHRAQQGLFQLDEDGNVIEPELPRHWYRVSDMVERGDSIEVLTPDGAVQGVVTKVTNKRGRARLTAIIEGREFLFNPKNNHLIVPRTMNPADLAWITGDAEYAQPGRITFPQTLVDINIGHLGKDGQWYADLADDFEYQAPLPWWQEYNQGIEYHPFVPYMPVDKEASDQQIAIAVRIANELTSGMNNLPKINVVRDLDSLRDKYPSVVQQMKDELGSSNFSGVRGYMDHINPENGIFIFPAHVSASVGSANYEMGIVETTWHELIGHYGVRGMFGNEADLRPRMHELVDAFPRLADFYASTLGLNKINPAEKQLLGEEMVAYIAGKVKSGELKFNQRQKSVWARFVAWIKGIMARRKMSRYAPVKKFVSLHETKEIFWNDSRVQDLLSRSRDFVRHANGFSWTPLEDGTKPFVRDRDIFQAGLITAMNTATFKPNNREKGELAKRYGGVENVPNEVPLFPDDATPNAWKQLIIKAQKDKLLTAREMELSGLSEKSEFYLFRDASYNTLELYMRSMNDNDLPVRWYQGIFPADVAAELDTINDAMEKNHLTGPLEEPKDERYRPVINPVTPDLMRERIAEIMTQKLNPKKTRLTKELMQAHMLSANVYRVYVEKHGSNPRMSLTEAQERLFGKLTAEEVDALTEEQMQMIRDERDITRTRGYDLGYNKDIDRWFDYVSHTTEYSEWSPQGSRFTRDFRVVLIKSEGRGGEMGYSGHYDPNMMHIRTGEAQLLEWDGMPELEYPNPAMEGKLLSLIELQSDWLQKLRKGFTNGDEKSAAEQENQERRNLLNMVGDQFGRGVGQDMWEALNAAIKPIINLPDGTDVELPGGTMFSEMRERAVRQTGDVWEDLSPDQKRGVWKDFTIEQFDKVRDTLSDARDWIDEEIGRLQDFAMPGTMDARAFEYLDNKAARRVTYAIKAELDKAIDTVQNQLRYSDDHAALLQNVNDLKQRFGQHMDRLSSNSDYGEGMRLPMIGYQLKPMLEPLYGRLGANSNRIEELLSGLGTREMATVRIPKETLIDANTAMTTGYDPVMLMNEIVAGSRVSRHSDITPGSLTLNAVKAGDAFIDVKVIGNKADVTKATDLIPKLIETWMDNHAEEKRRIATEARNNPTSGEAEGEFDYDELEDAYSLEEEDVESDSSEMMRSHGVSSFYDFEENDQGEHLADIIRYAFDNMTESDWDSLEDDYDGVSRQGSTYRDAVDIDEDGDVDNDQAESDLEDARDNYRNDAMYDDDTYREEANDRIREEWGERGPTALIHGSLPISWDTNNDPVNYVNIMIKAEDPGDSYDMIIDDETEDYESDLDDAKRGLSEVIKDYYNANGIVPPAGVPFGPVEAPTPAPTTEEETGGPNWDVVKGNILENMSMMSDESQKMDKVYETMVTVAKRVDNGQIHKDSPLGKDEQWRPLALKYLIADAVRRGLGGVMWNNGLSSATRGGMGMSDVQATSSITWSKETVGIRGEQQDVYIIRYPESQKPLVVAKNSMVPMLGADVARLIYQQENGKIETPALPAAVVSEPTEDSGPSRDDYIVAETNSDTRAIYRRTNNAFLGFAQDEDAVNQIIQQDIDHQGSNIRLRESGRDVDKLPPTGEPLGDVISQGFINEELAGGMIHIMTGGKGGRRFSHTFARPKLAGARLSYEDITVRQWNKELKKYGVHISDTYVKAQDMRKATLDEGQPTMRSPKRDQQIAEEHGSLYITETTTGMHNWIVMSEKQGPIINDVFTEKSYAQDRLDSFIQDKYGSDREGVRVMYFPINEKMREEFSGPVAPFHYDPTQDPELETATKKVGYQPKPLRERLDNWRAGMGAEARQGMVDQFYGLKRALNSAGQSDNAYISARLTTSLDSMMKGVLYYGHPVWSEGIVQSEGRGLIDILQPILNDPDTWGMYMAGKRGKALMLEGYNKLTPEDKKLIDKAASHFDGDILNMMAFAASYDPTKEHDPGTYQAKPIPKEMRQKIHNLELDIDDLKAVRDKGEYRDRDGRRMPKEWVEKTVTELGDKLLGVKQRRSPPTTEWIERVSNNRRFYQRQLAPEKGIAELEAQIAEIKAEFAERPKSPKRWAKRDDMLASLHAIAALRDGGREHLFEPSELHAMVKLGEKFPHFERVAKDYAAFNKKMLDFAEASGIIDADTRPTWESADYVPFYRVDDNRLVGSGMSPTAGIANQRAPIKRLHGGKENVSDIIGNIMMNITKLVDASVKNNAALESIDALRGSGIISKKPMDWKQELIPLAQLKKVLLDKGVIVPDDQKGIHMSDIPENALTGMQKMFALKAPQGDGIISVMRDGKREYYYTDDMLLWRSLGSINKKQFGQWINLFRAPKRLLTTLITIDPAFMLSNFIRDTGSAFVIGRDKGNLPVLSAIKGFGQALIEDETMRTLVSAGAAFENGYITGGDPRQTKKLLKAAMKQKGFTDTVLDTPRHLIRAWLHLGSSIENSNRMAIYNAAIAAGKSKKRAAYEAKDLMDFSMGGDWPVIQFLIQTVPFMNARAQGIYRLGRGAAEHPVSFTVKGLLVTLAGLSLYGAFKDDERYKQLEAWDRHAYYHWWIGEAHYRLPKPFEVGAIFNTIPEMMFNYKYDEETDAGKTLIKEFLHMLGETFNMWPIPQTVAPLIESGANHNFFTDRPIVSYYESKRLPPDQYRYRTSPTMIELARRLPAGMDTASGKIRSPLHLQNLYAGYTGTIGRYVLQASDMIVQRMLDYPAPPAYEIQDYPVLGRFNRGESPPRRTKYETEVYGMLDKITAIQGSLNFHEKQGNLDRYLQTHTEHEPYIRVAKDMENVRENIQDINRAIMSIHLDMEMDPQMKQKEIDVLEETRNLVFKEGWKLRPGGEYNPDDKPIETSQVIDLIDNWGVDSSTAYMRRIEEDAPNTAELLEMISNDMNLPQLASLAKIGEK